MNMIMNKLPLSHFLSFGKGISTPLLIVLGVAALISGVATYYALNSALPIGDSPDRVVLLLTVNLVILLLLSVLIAKRIAEVISGRRQGVAGSRLHVRLVVIFSIMAAAPAIIMAVFSAFFFHFGVQSWFSDRVRTAVIESQAVAESYLEEHQQVIKADLLAMAKDIDREAELYSYDRPAFDRFMETQSFLRNLSESMILDREGNILAQSGLTFTLTFEKLPGYLLDQADTGEVVITSTARDDRVRALVKLANFNHAYLFVGRMVDPTVLSHLAKTRSATEEYNSLQDRIGNLQFLVTSIFVAIAILLLLVATWFGMRLARQLVEPIGNLINASDRLRAGDTHVRVTEGSQIEEFDYLAKSFNRMTGQIQEQRDDLIMANRQLDHRRRFTETVLAGVSAGIIGVDHAGQVTLANTSAIQLLDQEKNILTGRSLESILPGISELLSNAQAKPGKMAQGEIPYLQRNGQKRFFLVRVGVDMMGEEERGAVITFDDITDLQSAQRKAAWADVARRIAHEIKNPLTPIMLSAERLKRKYGKEVQTDPQIFAQCIETIMRHVGDIGRMVNEFSAFARMPEPVMQSYDFNEDTRETLALQREAHSDIDIRLKGFLSSKTPIMMMADAQQIRQAMTNLIQNAIDSIHGRIQDMPGSAPGRIDVTAHIDKDNTQITCVIADNGRGLPKDIAPSQLMEPYVTRREKGTGLGLAIVKKIMQDHKGSLVLGADETVKGISDWEDLGGATISLVIPVQAQDNQSSMMTSSAPETPPKVQAIG